jgi:PAS domain S-box-containing protein
MNQIPVSVISMALPDLRERGVPLERWVAGLPITLDQLRNPHHRADWDLLVELIDRLPPLLRGGEDELEETAAHLYELPWLGLRRSAALLASPSALYHAVAQLAVPAFFPNVRHRLESRVDGRLVSIVEIPPEDRISPGVWRCIRGFTRGVPRALGLPDAHVEARIEGRRATFTITPPPARWIGARIWERVRGLFDCRELLDHFVVQHEVLARNIEELRQTNERLRERSEASRESEARYRALIDHTAELIVVCNERGRIHFASPSVLERFAIPAGARPDRDIFRRVHEDDRERVERVFRTLLQSGRTQRMELRVISGDGETVWLEASGQRLRGGDGRFRVLLVARDIDERKRAERERQRDAERLEIEVARRTLELQRANAELRELHTRLIRAERMDAAQELAGSVAHAINNPLAALIGHVEMMLEGQDDNDPKLERVLQLGQRIRSVVGRTLQLSREGRLNFSAQDPGEILQDVQEEIEDRASRRGVCVEIKREADLPRVKVDSTLLRAALVSIAENAVDASPEGGAVLLQAQVTSGGRVIEYRIEDAGPGIPPELRERILEPFFTTKPRGTGLGLAIARGVILGHSGRIRFTDRPGGGTLVTVEVPVEHPDG